MHLLGLLGDVHVDRRGGVDGIGQPRGVPKRLVRDRAQRVRRESQAQVGVAGEPRRESRQ